MPSERLFPALTTRKEPVGAREPGFTFAVMGETRPTLPRMPFPRFALETMRELALLQPAFVLCTGDTIWGYGDSEQEFVNELDRFRALADSTGVPLFNAPGNHEMRTDEAAISLLRSSGQELYGSFDFGPYHFVALNTDEFWKEGRVSGEQLEWLASDLELNRDARGIFVFMHRPLFSWFQGDFNPDDAAGLQALFGAYPVEAVFASHDHFHHEERHGGVRYLTVGGAGAPLYAQPTTGGFAHYLLVTVGPGDTDYNVVEPGHVEVAHVAGNDGLEAVSTARVANTTDRDLLLRNLEFRAPRLASPDGYRVSVSFTDWERKRVEHTASIGWVDDMRDGSVTVHVAVEIPTGTAFYVTLEAHHPPISEARG